MLRLHAELRLRVLLLLSLLQQLLRLHVVVLLLVVLLPLPSRCRLSSTLSCRLGTGSQAKIGDQGLHATTTLSSVRVPA